jgi:hypothetical protein
LILIKAELSPLLPNGCISTARGCVVSKIDLLYIGVVLFAFVGFAGVLAYYNHTCAEPHRKESEAEEKRPRPATSH